MRKMKLADGSELVQSRGSISRDMRIMRGLKRNHVVDGWVADVESGLSGDDVSISSGVGYVDGVWIQGGTSNVAKAPPDGTLPRYDTIEVDTNGTFHWVAGVAAAEPAPPLVTSQSRIVLARIYRDATGPVTEGAIDNSWRPSYDTSSITYRVPRRMV